MKAIIIRGAGNKGKSTTIREVCKRLKPQGVYKLDISKKEKVEEDIDKICNDIYLIEVNGKYILVFAGSPTEISVNVSVAVDICIKIGIEISFAIVSRKYAERKFTERKVKFDTRKELKEKGFEVIHEELVRKIEQNNFEQTEEWNKRVDNIVNKVNENLN